jgi:RNA polymerase primary sigma factor
LESHQKSSRYGFYINSFDEPIGSDGATHMDLLGRADDTALDREKSTIDKALVEKCLQKLPSYKHREILSLYFGITTGEPMTLDEIGNVFDISRERVRQLISKGIERIKDFKYKLMEV